MTEVIEMSAACRTMTEGTQEDGDANMSHLKPFAETGGARILAHLKLLEGYCGGFQVVRLKPNREAPGEG